MAIVTLVVSFLSISRLVQARAVVPDHRAIVYRQESSDDPVIVLPIQRLEGPVGANLSNYIINITIGAPAQPVPLGLKFANVDIRVNPRCESPRAPDALIDLCDSFLRYSAFASDTSKMLNGGKFGKSVVDKINVGSVDLEKVQIGLGGGNEAGKPFDVLGTFGVGKGSNMSVGPRLVALGKTRSSAFGMDLGAKNKSGSLIFGGIDTKKYKCHLEKNYYGNNPPSVGISAVGLLLEGTTEPYKTINLTTLNPESTYWPFVLIDAITENPFGTLRPSVFPYKLFREIGSSVQGARHVNAAFPIKEEHKDPDADSDLEDEQAKEIYNGPTFDAYTVPCKNPKGFLDITLGKSTNISVPLSHLIIPRNETGEECILSILATSLPPPPPSTNNTNTTTSINETLPAFQPQRQKRSKLKSGNTEYFILGSAIMEQAYMVFDHKRTDIWIGERTDCGEQIMPIGQSDGGDTPGVLKTEGCGCNGTSGRVDDGGAWTWSEKAEVKKNSKASPILGVFGALACMGVSGWLVWRYRANIVNVWYSWDPEDLTDKWVRWDLWDKCREWYAEKKMVH